MELVKKNWLSITFGVIALLAIAADFYPMSGMREELKQEAVQHASNASTLRGLSTKTRYLPILHLGSSQQVPLNGFPTSGWVEAGKKATAQVNTSAEQLMTKAMELTRHTPLVADSLPGVQGETRPASTFAREYTLKFPTPIIAGAPVAVTPPPATPDSLVGILHAVSKVTESDIANESAIRAADIRKKERRLDANNQPNDKEVEEIVAAELRVLAVNMRKQRAKSGLCYAEADAFSMYPGIKVNNVPAPTDIFWAQVGLWVQEDICRALYEINKSHSNVMDAPVKQVVKIAFVAPGQTGQGQANPTFVLPNSVASAGVFGSSGGGGGGGGFGGGFAGGRGGRFAEEDIPLDIPIDSPTAAPTATGGPTIQVPAEPVRNTLVSPTGRNANAMFDVIHFDVELIVDSTSVSKVLEGLCAGKYINVNWVMTVDPVDSAAERAKGFYFGNKPCVRVRARCEELFFRSWLDPLVPLALRPSLGYPPPAAAAPAQ